MFYVLSISYSNLESFEVEEIDAEVLFDLSYMSYTKMLLQFNLLKGDWHLCFGCVRTVLN